MELILNQSRWTLFRKRMNEYLCHGYIAEEIFKEVSTPRVKRRPESVPNSHNFLDDDNVTIHDKLLADEGSTKYKNWLQRWQHSEIYYKCFHTNAFYNPTRKIKVLPLYGQQEIFAKSTEFFCFSHKTQIMQELCKNSNWYFIFKFNKIFLKITLILIIYDFVINILRNTRTTWQ